MADDVTVDNGTGTDYDVATDDDGSGNHVQIVKLAQAADGSRTPIAADANGMLVNLGANNDVTVTSGNITADTELPAAVTLADNLTPADTPVVGSALLGFDGTNYDRIRTTTGDGGGGTGFMAVLPYNYNGSNYDRVRGDSANGLDVDVTRLPALAAGTNNIGDVDVLTLPSIPAGTNNIGDVDVLTMPGTFAEDAAHNSGDTGHFVLGVRNTAMSTLTTTDGDYSPIAVDSAGRPNVSGQIAHDAAINGNPLAIAGVASAAAPSDVSADQDAVRFWALRNGAQCVQITAAGALIPGDATLGLRTNITPKTSGGLSLFRSIDLDETEEDVKTSAGQLYGWYLWNGHTAVLYVKLYNATAANVTVGTTTPVLTIPVPPASAANVEFTQGIAFSTAICAAATTGVADNDTGAPAANVLVANFFYA